MERLGERLESSFYIPITRKFTISKYYVYMSLLHVLKSGHRSSSKYFTEFTKQLYLGFKSIYSFTAFTVEHQKQ